MRLHAVSTAALLVFALNAATADDKDSGQKTYRVNLAEREHVYKASQRFRLAASAEQTQTIRAPKFEGGTTSSGEKSSVRLRGTMEVVEVTDGEPTRLRVAVEEFDHTTDDVGKKAEPVALKKGDVLIAESGKGRPRYTVGGSDAKLSGDVRDLLDDLLPLEGDGADGGKGGEKAPDFLEQIKEREEWTVGRPVDVRPEKLPEPFKGDAGAKFTITLVGPERVEGVECLHFRIECRMEAADAERNEFPGARARVTFDGTLHGYLPRDPGQPARKSTRDTRFRVEFTGKGANIFDSMTATRKTERLLIPADKE